MTTVVAPQPSSSSSSSSSISSSVVLEISVISIEGLNNYTSLLSPTIRPFITITRLPTQTHLATVENGGRFGLGLGPTPFRVTVDQSFFTDGYSCLHLQLFNKRRIVGPAQLGWCVIPPSDIGLLPPTSVSYLSYRLRATDGSRGQAIINISVRLDRLPWVDTSVDACHTVIGIPVTAVRRIAQGKPNVRNSCPRARKVGESELFEFCRFRDWGFSVFHITMFRDSFTHRLFFESVGRGVIFQRFLRNDASI
ncbi:hypothetical protein PIB30_009534 [Stylosanthes scabra]|uniref:Uncharacterized protein n=1 Tax=Stylosanthes scabra TaxID=79078 RepID=A0ABU6Z2Y2_9FABA|nr:hypothetical protein [Stylosanthes scabra]